MRHMNNPWALGLYPALLLTGLTLGVIVTLAWDVFADGDPTTDNVPRTLPYQGTLELNGEPVEATGDNALHILFELYDGQAAEAPAYQQPLIVEVYAGRFTATIGPLGLNANGDEVIISDIIANADDLYLGMTLLGDPEDPADDVALSNRQRIHASPYAMWSTTATNFTVANTLGVGGSVNVGGDVVADGDVDADGDVRAGGALSGGSLNLSGGMNVSGGATLGGNLSANNLNVNSISSSGSISGNFQLNTSGPTYTGRDSTGESRLNLGSTSRRFCYLIKAAYKDIEGGNEEAECLVDTGGGQWRLRAIVHNSGDANAHCGARCVSW